jgi:hypothetical protein
MDATTRMTCFKAAGAFGRAAAFAGLLVLPWCLSQAMTTDEMLGGLDDDKAGEAAADLLGLQSASDLSKLGATHLSLLSGWGDVQRRKKKGAAEPEAAPHWKDENGIVRPLDAGAISTLIGVPEDGRYRLFLRHQLSSRSTLPVTFSLTPQSETPDGTNGPVYADAGAPLSHVFGMVRLAGSQIGKLQEKALPIRFEAETQLISAPPEPAMVWEYTDLELKKGAYVAALSNAAPGVRAQALFMTRSPDFRPSFSPFAQDKTLGRLYLRFRSDGGKAGSTFTTSSDAAYHWGPRDEAAWNWPIGETKAAPAGEWSPFVEATDALYNGPGPWSTCWIHFNGIPDGAQAEIQFAWYPHEKAVLLSTRSGIGEKVVMLRVPNGDWSVRPSSTEPAWGMAAPAVLKNVMTQESVIQRYFEWADRAAQALDLKPGHPRPKLVRIYSGCGVREPNRERAAEMLARLGINWIDGAPESVIKKYGLIEELSGWHGNGPIKQAARVTKMQLADEIGTRTDASVINGDIVKRRAFQAYLAGQAALEDQPLDAFLGVQDVNDIACLDRLPPNPGRFERRLFYHSQRFAHLTTCDGYAAQVKAIEKKFPNARVFNNYSPHPLFLTGTTMNESDWFILARNRAQTLGWGEDWATGGSWGLGTAFQCTSFYAALVDCSVRKYGYAAGFYVGSNCAGSAQKIFGCLAMGVNWLHLYDWGPIDRWAEGSNAWSEHESEYYSVMAATHAIGPADTILGAGAREPRRVAVLYNRSHEILQGGTGRANHDWMWTFLAMKHAHIPVEVIIEEDLNPEDLKRYDCIFLGGFNLARYHLAELRKWVENGGLLIGSAGAAHLDIYNDRLAEAVDLFGAVQTQSDARDTGTVAAVRFPASPWFPAAEFKKGASLAFFLEPTTGTPLGTYEGGPCAAVGRTIGKGQTILLGFQPGMLYRDNGKALGPARDWLAAPVLKRLGRQRVEFDWPFSEATLFEHESGLAVMLADFSRPARGTNSLLSVRADRPVTQVVSALKGPLEWKRNGDRIDIVTQPLNPVDVVILK